MKGFKKLSSNSKYLFYFKEDVVMKKVIKYIFDIESYTNNTFLLACEAISLKIYEHCPHIVKLLSVSENLKEYIKQIIETNNMDLSVFEFETNSLPGFSILTTPRGLDLKQKINIEKRKLETQWQENTTFIDLYANLFDEKYVSTVARALCKATYCLCKTFKKHNNEFKCHLDIKPENIIDHNGSIYFIDISSHFYNEKEYNGTPLYWPRQRFLHPERPRFSDELYSIGIVLYFLLTGDPFWKIFSDIPHYSIDAATAFGVSSKRFSSELKEFLPNMKDSHLKRLVFHLLHKDVKIRIRGFQKFLFQND